MADIEGDENDNTLNGTSGADKIDGNGGNDTISGSGGNDTITGGSGNDSIDGGSGNDTIYGGDGNDSITGGSGDDIIVGGRGDDTMAAGNGSTTDTFVIRDGDGNDTITDFDPSEPDIVRFDMVEMNTYQDVLDRISTDGPDTIITYDNGSTLRLQNTNPGDLSATNFEFAPGPVCLEAGTLVETPEGLQRIEDLRPGDLVVTLDHGPQPIVEIVEERVRFGDRNDRRRPILLKEGALGPRTPRRDLVVSPQHRLVVRCPHRDADVLVAAFRIQGRKGIRRMSGRREAHYFNLLMASHEIIFANGCRVETLLLSGPVAWKLDGRVPEFLAPTSPARPVVAQDPLVDAGFVV